MGLEAATYIHQLDPANPVGGSDPKSQGDDHFHLLKETLQNTFPNIEGAVTASHSELNILDGVTADAADINKLDGLAAAFGEACMCEIALLHCSAAGAIQQSHNIASVTPGGSGSYTITFTADMGNTPFVVCNTSGSARMVQVNRAIGGSCFIQIIDHNGSGTTADFQLIAFRPKFTIDDPT